MDINKKITITLSENDVKEIVAEYLTSNGYRVDSDDVSLNVIRTTVGYGMAEHEVVRFKDCTAVVKGD